MKHDVGYRIGNASLYCPLKDIMNLVVMSYGYDTKHDKNVWNLLYLF